VWPLGKSSNLAHTRDLCFALGLLVSLVVLADPVQAEDRPSDSTISQWVADALREDPRTPLEAMSIAVRDGIVTLTGTAWDLASNRYAVQEAEKIRGVRGVVDNLRMDIRPRDDAQIAQDIRQRILHSSSIETPRIEVDVDSGNVVLTGLVASWAEAAQADLLASETGGVRSVDNRLQVDLSQSRTDDEVRKDVESVLARDIYLTGLPILVSVKDGAVVLTGEVGTAYQKARAGKEVRWIRSVREVKNKLAVRQWADKGSRVTPPEPTDAQLARRTREELRQDVRLDPSDVQVSAASGHITLEGSIPTFYERRVAGMDARDVVGAVWVTNHLRVTGQRRPDEQILTDIRDDFASDYDVLLDRVAVRVDDGLVTLSGQVGDLWPKSHAYDVASRVRGVRGVVNNIEVKYSTPPTDASIRDRIKGRLATNAETRPVADHIQVGVDAGQVTLDGAVDSWSEYVAAQALAFTTKGVWSVKNMLTVRGCDFDSTERAHPWPAARMRAMDNPYCVYNLWW
jgi:osmotically-inducible protein OsmY